MRPLLPAVMDVLDRADASVSRERLLAAAQEVATHHTSETLTAAVDAHLAASVPTLAPSPTPFVFPWKRPRTPSERTARLAKSQKWSRIWDRSNRVGVFLGTLVLMGISPAVGTALTFGREVFKAQVTLSMVGCVFLPALLVTSVFMWSIFRAMEHENLQEGSAIDEDACLKYPQTRAYLRAMLSSDCPDLMAGDLHCLSILLSEQVAKEWAARAAEAASETAERRAEQAARAPQIRAERQARLTRALLAQDSNGTPSAP
jgi:hypothetical protein